MIEMPIWAQALLVVAGLAIGFSLLGSWWRDHVDSARIQADRLQGYPVSVDLVPIAATARLAGLFPGTDVVRARRLETLTLGSARTVGSSARWTVWPTGD
jgi:hypothetical protein